jgi:hypothetical protein
MKIKGSLDLSQSSIESLGNLEEIIQNFRGLYINEMWEIENFR